GERAQRTLHYGLSVGFLRCASPARWTMAASDLRSAQSMNALPDAASASAPEPVADRAARAREGICLLEGDLPLFFGGSLSDVRVAWRMVGPPDAPVVAALGGISAGRYVTSEGEIKGWWAGIVGDGMALDTTRFRVLGIDFLGGSGETTGPRPGQADFPSISAY